MDIRLSEAVSGGQAPEDACAAMASDFEGITDARGRDLQLDSYKKSLGL
jgi:hypothetical protein